MVKPKNGTEDLSLLITKKCETLIKQTFTRPEETHEFKPNKSRESFHFNPPIPIEGSWMIGLTSLELYNSIFNINRTNTKFELYTDSFDESSFEEFKDQLEAILSISYITPYHPRHEKIGPRNIEAYRKLGLEKSGSDGCIILLMGYALSIWRF